MFLRLCFHHKTYDTEQTHSSKKKKKCLIDVVVVVTVPNSSWLLGHVSAPIGEERVLIMSGLLGLQPQKATTLCSLELLGDCYCIDGKEVIRAFM